MKHFVVCLLLFGLLLPSPSPALELSTGSSFGRLEIQPKATKPKELLGPPGVPGRGFPDVTMLSFWGAVVIAGTATGFAMEFLGDFHDSRFGESLTQADKIKVVAPYWQASNGIYTLMAATHPSMVNMNSQIGMAVIAFNNDGSIFGSTEFTVSPNQTKRIFITTNKFPGAPTANFIIPSIFASPLELITLTGSGFDPAAETTVRFFDDQGFSVDLPAVTVTPGDLKVHVPPFVNITTGVFSEGTVNVQIKQTRNGGTITSNTLSGLRISSLPDLSLPPGSVTANLAGFMELYLQDVQDHLLEIDNLSSGVDTTGLRADLENIRLQMSTLKSQINDAIANPGSAPVIGTIQGQSITLDPESLRLSDQWLLAMFDGISKDSGNLPVGITDPVRGDTNPCAVRFREWQDILKNNPGASLELREKHRQLFQNTCWSFALKGVAGLSAFGATVGVLTGAALGVTVTPLVVPLAVIASGAYAIALALDYSTFVQSSDRNTAEQLLKSFEDFLFGHLKNMAGALVGAVTATAGILFDIVDAIDGMARNKIKTYVDQIRTVLSEIIQPPAPSEFTGSFNTSGGFANTNDDCTFNVSFSGTINISLTIGASGSVSGTGAVNGNWNSTPTGGTSCASSSGGINSSSPVSGTTSSISFSSGTFPMTVFNGSLGGSGTSISGALTFTITNTTGQAQELVTLNKI